jgi:hypothetical protein
MWNAKISGVQTGVQLVVVVVATTVLICWRVPEFSALL